MTAPDGSGGAGTGGGGPRSGGRISGGKLLLGAVVAVVLVVVGAAVMVIDSPSEQRRQRLDEHRVRDLQAIARTLDDHWTEQESLPEDLDALAGWTGSPGPPADPVTGEPYPYRPTGDRTYELCATFATRTPEEAPEPRRVWLDRDDWHHGRGEHCFEKTAREVDR